MLIYADPVTYEERIRSIRVSNHPREAKAYLSNMYRHEGNNRFKFACQLCHETCSSFEATELFLKPETELDPVNLCLCPNCAAAYRRIRANEDITGNIRKAFLSMNDTDIENSDYDSIPQPPYGIGFVQSYANFLGLNSARIVQIFKEEMGEPSIPVTTLPTEQPISEEEEAPTSNRKYIVISLILLILCYGLWNKFAPESSVDETSPSQEIVSASENQEHLQAGKIPHDLSETRGF